MGQIDIFWGRNNQSLSHPNDVVLEAGLSSATGIFVTSQVSATKHIKIHCTVEAILKDQYSLVTETMDSEDWGLSQAQFHCQVEHSTGNIRSLKGGDLSWQWSLNTGVIKFLNYMYMMYIHSHPPPIGTALLSSNSILIREVLCEREHHLYS